MRAVSVFTRPPGLLLYDDHLVMSNTPLTEWSYHESGLPVVYESVRIVNSNKLYVVVVVLVVNYCHFTSLCVFYFFFLVACFTSYFKGFLFLNIFFLLTVYLSGNLTDRLPISMFSAMEFRC